MLRHVPDELRFFGSPIDDFNEVSNSVVVEIEGNVDGCEEFVVDIEVGKLDAAAERARDKSA